MVICSEHSVMTVDRNVDLSCSINEPKLCQQSRKITCTINVFTVSVWFSGMHRFQASGATKELTLHSPHDDLLLLVSNTV